MPNEHGKYLSKRLPFKIGYTVYGGLDHVLQDPNFIELGLTKDNSMLFSKVVPKGPAQRRRIIHRNPEGIWAFYRNTLYFKNRNLALRLKLAGLVTS